MLAKIILCIAVLLSIENVRAFEFVEDQSSSGALTLRDGDSNVLTYNYGDQLPTGTDSKYTRSSYIHPLWGIDGKKLTEDFPDDHPHHHGVFWAWPIVKARGLQTQNWHPHQPSLRHHFVRWIKKTAGTEMAIIAVENKWLLNEKTEIARERVTITVSSIISDSRAIDVQIELEAVGGPLTLQGSQEADKGYGGFCFRAATLFKGARIRTDSGNREKDIVLERHKWVDLSATDSGVTIFAAPDHPDYPPYWMARNSYAGFANASWPGLSPTELQPGSPVTLRYRLIIHKGQKVPPNIIQQAYESYLQGL